MDTLEYKLLEWRLIINKELYEEGVIDLNTFSLMEEKILRKIKLFESRSINIENITN